MARETELDRQWRDLMSLCSKERDYAADNSHPKLLRVITKQIDQLAADMGFKPRQIVNREFRAEKDGDRILRLIFD